ncbi:hypothetical protein CYMTET_24237 [Cymbomonas tetramitiformis]|uniref:Right handed beta helix domain-containing protein n=1 Tax=Cymbomonas tetramitiformis TaxID=36881 RepID=A0AAE0FWS8_9CHLO|nr:hypothetical protein CYMTET_24237 [Cymbomonas tetramitiformis]
MFEYAGGIYAKDSEIQIYQNSAISNNIASTDGAGIYVMGELAMVNLTQCRIQGNEAKTDGGGVMALSEATLLFDKSQFTENHAQRGAATAASNVNVSIVRSNFTANKADVMTSGLLLKDLAVGALYHVLFQDNRGVAVSVVESSVGSLYWSTIENNTNNDGADGKGAGLVVEEHSMGVVSNCHFKSNQGRNGSAAYVSGDATFANCTFENNTADNGPIYISLNENTVTLEHSTLLANQALKNGAALYLVDVSAAHAFNSSFTHLRAEHNSALLGGASVVFWETWHKSIADGFQAIKCIDCTFANNTASYSTKDGWATAMAGVNLDEQHPIQQGGATMEPPIRVELVDMFGTVEPNTIIEVQVAVVSLEMLQCSLVGAQRNQSYAGVVTFTQLSINGPVGEECLVEAVAILANGVKVNATTVVPLRHCEPGEKLQTYGSSQTCTKCKSGTLGLGDDINNGITECLECSDGLECPGGSSYTLENGYWLAPHAEMCGSAQCLMDRLLPCTVGTACTTDLDRSGTADRPVTYDNLCALDKGFTSGVMCGGTEAVICDSGFTVSVEGDKCEKCPSSAATLTTFLAVSVVIVLMTGGLSIMIMSKAR